MIRVRWGVIACVSAEAHHLFSVSLKIDIVQAADVRVELEGCLSDGRVPGRYGRPRGRRGWGRRRWRRPIQPHGLKDHR